MSKKGKRAKQNSIDLSQAIGLGISAIVKAHPRFKGLENYIAKHIDNNLLNNKAQEAYQHIQQNNELRNDPNKANQYLIQTIASYVASGQVLDEVGQETVLKKSLEDRANQPGILSFFGRRAARNEIEGVKYLDKTTAAFSELYELFKSGDYAQHMPEVAQAVSTIYSAGFLDAAVDLMSHYKIIDSRKYNLIKKNIRRKVKESEEEAVSAVEKYSMPKSMAAAVLGISGIGIFLATGTGITGNVISNAAVNSSLLGFSIGTILIASSLLLFFRARN